MDIFSINFRDIFVQRFLHKNSTNDTSDQDQTKNCTVFMNTVFEAS